jgi:hypothetical protein
MTEPLEWPDDSSEWWWMRFKLKPRGKWRTALVRTGLHHGRKFVCQFQDNNWFPRKICAEWKATFLPAAAPPKEWQ